ncbi:MAG: phosphatidate cytidylyltransferase [Bacteroidota bacterium]
MSIQDYHIAKELVYILIGVFSVLTICSIAFSLMHKRNPSDSNKELVLRTRSWWFIALGLCLVILAPPIFGTILIAYISFVALREMFSISGMRESDRVAMFVAYFAIPIQYYLAYKMYFTQFLAFIPLGMFMLISFVLVMGGNTAKIGRSMPLIPTLLMLTTYMLSHIVLLFNVEVSDFEVGAGGLIFYLVAITSFNDVFQFVWGKALGKRKILPTVSPNKTWAGFVGGVLTTAVFSYCIRFLTPLADWEALVTGLILGVMGFFGDSLVSAVKRDLQLKDTDDLIPGHGGAMDRLDSILITAPVFFHLLTFFT